MINLELLSRVLPILAKSNLASVDLHYIKSHIQNQESTNIHGNVRLSESKSILEIFLYSLDKQGNAIIRAVWVAPQLRRRGTAVKLLRNLCKKNKQNNKLTTARISYTDDRLGIVKLLVKSGFRFIRYVPSLNYSEYGA